MQIPETEIIVSKDGTELLRKTVRPGDYVIGREPGCEVQVEADLVSRRHAQLTVNYDHVLIEDLGSSNGTFVNGQRVTESTRLWPNQKIQVGAATIELRRIKTVPPPDVSLAPQTAAVQRLLPEELLREKKYDIGKVVAEGGMGAILDAKEANIERRVAMKVMLDGSSPDDITRFVAEAKITGQLEHPSIVPVYELSVDENGQPFYTMKMVRGITLRKVLELVAEGVPETVKKYPLPALLTIFQKVCDALAFAHSRGVIHRDLKPENIMLDDFGVVLVMDWGLAKIIGKKDAPAGDLTRSAVHTLPPEGSGATLTGTIMGTPQYMSPEQARGEVEDLDLRSDIYALGAILYHILALRPPVNGNDAWAIVAKVAKGEVELLTAAKNRVIPDSLAAVVRKTMAFDKSHRYESVESLQRDLTAYQSGFATSAEKARLGKQLALLLQRHKGVSVAATTAIVLLVAVSGAFTIRVIRERDRSDAALASLRKAAPTLSAQAKSLVAEQKLDEAVEKLDFALTIDPKNASYALQRANYLQAALHLREARDGYRSLLRRGTNAEATANLTLCEKLIAAYGDGPLPDAALDELRAVLVAQSREAEAMPLTVRLGKGKGAIIGVLRERLAAWQKLPGWREDRIRVDEGGRIRVSIDNLPISDLSPLRGLYVEAFTIGRTKVTELRSLAGMRLREFVGDNTRELRSIAGLEGAPLDLVFIGNTSVADLSPLMDSPIRAIRFQNTLVTDLSPLRNCPLDQLIATRTAIQSIEVLRGKMLRCVSFGECQALIDISPLKDCPTLEQLVLPPHARNIEFLRAMPRLQKLSYQDNSNETVAQFWAEYDAQHPTAR